MFAKRLGVVVGGYGIASIASGATLAIGGMFFSVVTSPIADPENVTVLQVLSYLVIRVLATGGSAFFFAFFIGIFALFPSSIFISAGELFGIRNRVYYALTACFVALLVYRVPLYPAIGYKQHELISVDALIYGVTGLVAGLVYWAFSGRDAKPALEVVFFKKPSLISVQWRDGA
jgi:hypothetical protein